jgi:outer membrane protein TolC
MKPRHLLALLCWHGAAALAQDAAVMPIARPAGLPGANVQSLLMLARAQNPELAVMRLEAQAAQARTEQADALPDPRLKIELQDITRMGAQNPTLWPSDVASTRYTLTQELPWFGTRALKREQAALTALGVQTQVQTAWADVAARIKLAYAQLYFLQRNQALSRDILGLMQRLEQLARARYAAGLAPQQDVLRAQTEQTAMQSELIALQAEAHHTRARMNALLARPIHAELAEPESLRPLPTPAELDFDLLSQRALAHNPQLAASEATLQAASKGQALALQGRYPTFTLGVAPTQFQNDLKTWDLMLEMNIPLQQGTRRAQEREALAMVEAAQARREVTQRQLLADLSENLDALLSAQDTEALVTHRLLPQADLSLQSALAGYEAGKGEFASVLEAHRQIRQAKQTLIKAQAEGQARLAQLERLLGEEP